MDIGRVGVGLTAGFCLFAFTATSSVDRYVVSSAADITNRSQNLVTDSSIQLLFDRIAQRSDMKCNNCFDTPSSGRTYSNFSIKITMGVKLDAERSRLSVFVEATDIVTGAWNAAKVSDATRRQVDRIAQDVKSELKTAFPNLELQPWTDQKKG